jgi:hypothetical protein
MMIIALVLALIGLVALVFAVVTSNELVAWVCIGASVLGAILLIVDAIRERQQREVGDPEGSEEGSEDDAENVEDDASYVDYPEEASDGATEGAQDAHVGAEESSEPKESAVPADHGSDESAK